MVLFCCLRCGAASAFAGVIVFIIRFFCCYCRHLTLSPPDPSHPNAGWSFPRECTRYASAALFERRWPLYAFDAPCERRWPFAIRSACFREQPRSLNSFGVIDLVAVAVDDIVAFAVGTNLQNPCEHRNPVTCEHMVLYMFHRVGNKSRSLYEHKNCETCEHMVRCARSCRAVTNMKVYVTVCFLFGPYHSVSDSMYNDITDISNSTKHKANITESSRMSESVNPSSTFLLLCVVSDG